MLDLSVECSYFEPDSTSANKSTELHKENILLTVLTSETEWGKYKMYAMASTIQKHPAFDTQRSREWFQKQLRDCATKCVRARLEQVARK